MEPGELITRLLGGKTCQAEYQRGWHATDRKLQRAGVSDAERRSLRMAAGKLAVQERVQKTLADLSEARPADLAGNIYALYKRAYDNTVSDNAHQLGANIKAVLDGRIARKALRRRMLLLLGKDSYLRQYRNIYCAASGATERKLKRARVPDEDYRSLKRAAGKQAVYVHFQKTLAELPEADGPEKEPMVGAAGERYVQKGV